MNSAADISATVDAVVARVGRERRHLVAWLHALQDEVGYVPRAALECLAHTTQATLAELTDVVTFHPHFRLSPCGRHRIRVCVGTACHVKGAETLFGVFREHLGIAGEADTDADGLFTVEKVACLGCCSLAPAVQIGDLLYGPVATADVPRVLRDFLATADAAPVRAAETVASPALTLRLCTCTSCAAAGAVKTAAALRSEAKRLGMTVRVLETACLGASFDAPLVDAIAGRSVFRYARVRPHHAESLLMRHAGSRRAGAVGAALQRLLERLPAADPHEDSPRRYWPDALPGSHCEPGGFWGHQARIATAQAGELAPLDLTSYCAAGGFAELARGLGERTPDDIVGVLRAAGLRGRGGAGFPTAEKWATVSRADDPVRFVVCNGDEGDPGAFMDRMVLESFPFRVLEGMLIAARVVRARLGFLYIRAEYPLATRRMRAAIAECERAGLLGGNAPMLEVVEGAGAFVCGEETALLASIEGRRGMPAPRPPYPAERGLWGHPTLVNNVETFAVVSWILRHGAAEFRKQGTAQSPGTKAFALAGDIQRGGLVEVPMGLTLRRIIEEVGGGTNDGRPFKAIQVGGPSGGCIPYAASDVPVDYEALLSAGAMMGSGGLVVLGQRDCIVDIVLYFLRFTASESCGRCVPCRMGSRKLLGLLDALATGTAKAGVLEDLEETAAYVKANSLCGLGRSAPNPVISALRHFRSEFEAHVEGRCPAGRCKGLGRRVVTDDCIGCTRCAQVCPVDAVRSVAYQQHEIDPAVCTLCDACIAACPAGAIRATTR
jgi:NADH-quinone oxidoreductase subunit F